MEKSITINGKEYKIPEINYGAICRLEELGMDFQDSTKAFSYVRALVALTEDCTLKKATDEIDAHIKNGGNFEDFTPLISAIGESDFFQNLSKKRKK